MYAPPIPVAISARRSIPIKPGDTLASIAKRYERRGRRHHALEPGVTKVDAGQKLTLEVRAPAPRASRAPEAKPARTVQDTHRG